MRYRGYGAQIIKLKLLYEENTIYTTMYTTGVFSNIRRGRGAVVIQAKRDRQSLIWDCKEPTRRCETMSDATGR